MTLSGPLAPRLIGSAGLPLSSFLTLDLGRAVALLSASTAAGGPRGGSMTAAAAPRVMQHRMQRAVLRMVKAQGHLTFPMLISKVPGAVKRDLVVRASTC